MNGCEINIDEVYRVPQGEFGTSAARRRTQIILRMMLQFGFSYHEGCIAILPESMRSLVSPHPALRFHKCAFGANTYFMRDPRRFI